MGAGVVHKNVKALVRGQNPGDGLLPGRSGGHVQRHDAATIGIRGRQLRSLLATAMQRQPHDIVRRFIQKGARDGAAKVAVGAGD